MFGWLKKKKLAHPLCTARDLLRPALFEAQEKYGLPADSELDMWVNMIDGTLVVKYYREGDAPDQIAVLSYEEVMKGPAIYARLWLDRMQEFTERIKARLLSAQRYRSEAEIGEAP